MITWPGTLAAAVVLAAVASCGKSGCTNSVRERITSPDGRYDAVVFDRDCGATTAISVQVALVEVGGSVPDKPANVFVSEDNPRIKLEWRARHHLLIMFDAASRVTRREDRQNGVMISYDDYPTRAATVP